MAIYPANPAPLLPGLIEKTGLAVPQIVAIDVGCSGGVSPEWWPYLPLMEVYGIDPLVKEIERLKRDAPMPNVEYFDGFVDGPSPAPFPPLKGPLLAWFNRVASMAAHAHLARNYDQIHFNAGQEIVRSDKRFTIDQFCAEHAIERVDFLKSDTDGFDWNVLRGAEQTLKNVVAVHVEATFATEGSGSVFRHIDQTMNDSGFYLAGLNPITYTRAALPGRFSHSTMADNVTGATSWADFLYLRDVAAHGPHDLETVLRLAIMAEMFNLPDVAAEALLVVKAEHPVEIEALLDGLVPYSGLPDAGSYAELMRRFAENPQAFAPPT